MTVVHCKRAPYTVYIGRPSRFGNPFHVSRQLSRAAAIARFEAYARETPALLAAIRALPADAVLGCWCAPLPCHGDVIVTLWNEQHAPPTTSTTGTV